MRPSAQTGGDNNVTNRTKNAARSIGTPTVGFDLLGVGYMGPLGSSAAPPNAHVEDCSWTSA
jgi:hypothetical protein